jgi:hypothetical protein
MVPCADDEYGRVMVDSDRTYQEFIRPDGSMFACSDATRNVVVAGAA